MKLIIVALLLCMTSFVHAQSYKIDRVSYRDSLSTWYEDNIGIKEATGNNDGPMVYKMMLATGLDGNYPWCGAYVNYPFTLYNLEHPKYPARAASWGQTAERLVWKRGQKFVPDSIQQTDIGTLWYNSLNRIGHVFAIDYVNSGVFITWEGNTNAEGSREGNQSAKRRRLTRTIYRVERWTPEDKITKTLIKIEPQEPTFMPTFSFDLSKLYKL